MDKIVLSAHVKMLQLLGTKSPEPLLGGAKHICFLLPTMHNNCFNFLITPFYLLFYAPGTYILVCSAGHGCVSASLTDYSFY